MVQFFPGKKAMSQSDELRQRVENIKEHAKRALDENPNAMIRYRIEIVLGLADELISELDPGAAGGSQRSDAGAKERARKLD